MCLYTTCSLLYNISVSSLVFLINTRRFFGLLYAGGTVVSVLFVVYGFCSGCLFVFLLGCVNCGLQIDGFFRF